METPTPSSLLHNELRKRIDTLPHYKDERGEQDLRMQAVELQPSTFQVELRKRLDLLECATHWVRKMVEIDIHEQSSHVSFAENLPEESSNSVGDARL